MAEAMAPSVGYPTEKSKTLFLKNILFGEISRNFSSRILLSHSSTYAAFTQAGLTTRYRPESL